jgi:hypothetical protein
MGKSKPAESPGQPVLPLSDTPGKANGTAPGPGFTSLLQGPRNGQGAPGTSSQTPSPDPGASQARSPSLTWTLLAADALLVVLAAWQVTTRRGHLGFWGGLLTVLAVGLGAWLGCSAFLHRRPDD